MLEVSWMECSQVGRGDWTGLQDVPFVPSWGVWVDRSEWKGWI